LTLEQTVTLKNYFRHNEKATPEEWFNSLSKKRKKVLRTGNITYEDNSFHPDYIPEQKSIIKNEAALFKTLQKNSVLSFSFINFL
jgi:hypothetical protein